MKSPDKSVVQRLAWKGPDQLETECARLHRELIAKGFLSEGTPLCQPGILATIQDKAAAAAAGSKGAKEKKKPKAIEPAPKTPDTHEKSVEKRALYTEVGLLEIQYIRNRSTLAPEKQAYYDAVFNGLNGALKVHVKKSGPSLMAAIKALAAISYLVVTAAPMFLFLTARLLHPTLRKVGVKNNYLPADLLQRLYAHGYCKIFGVNATAVEGNPDMDHSTILFFQHGSNLDPFVITAFSPIVAKWIGKKSIFMVPLFGWLAFGFGFIPIDRGNLQNAIASLDDAKKRIERYNRSIAISPEGTRSTTGQLAPFKKGPFHLAKQTNLPVTPVLIQGAYELWPPGQIWPTPGDVTVRFLDPIKPKDGESVDDMMLRVREQYLLNIPDMKLPRRRAPTVMETVFPLLQLVIPAYMVYSRM